MRVFTLGTALSLASIVYSQQSQFCPPGLQGICYSVNIPESTATSGNGDIFFQISAPSGVRWVGLGEGGVMAGANIFVVYSAADPNNVTLSPRSGLGHFQSLYNPQAQVSLLPGSGISNGKLVANVRCSNCVSWSGGTLDVKSSSSSWIWAMKQGSPLDSNDPAANIQQHDNNGQFTFDLTKAAGGNSVNPFVGATTSAPGSTATGSGGALNGAAGQVKVSKTTTTNSIIAHGTLMGLAVVVILPLGALMMRLFSFPSLVRVHVFAQVLGFTVLLAGFGVGVWVGVITNNLYNSVHPIFGTVIVGLLFFQPLLGMLHHRLLRKKGYRTVWGYWHIWYGRILLILALVNGVLGFQLAANTLRGMIAYEVIAAVILLVYVTVLGVIYLRSGRETWSNIMKALNVLTVKLRTIMH